jgi:uncharacterized spore protein YtfJ
MPSQCVASLATPYERDGALVIPVARVRGGGGGGEGRAGTEPLGSGWGGVYVIRDGRVSWQPAVDVTRIALQGQIVVIVALLVARSIIRRLMR